MTTTETKPSVLSPQELIDSLENIRQEHYKRYPYKVKGLTSPEDFPAAAASKLRTHSGGDINHRFEGERYINCTEKSMRRKQLRKLVDEGGEVSVGGEKVSHPLLARWESYSFGVTKEQVDAAEKGDADPTILIFRGWHVARDRYYSFPVAIGSGLVGEGENRLFAEQQMAQIEKDAEKLRAWGMPNIDEALLNRKEHAGIDVEHAEFNERVIKQYCTTPKLQEQISQVFTLRLQQRAQIK
jgi:pyrroloquinoline quinone (PQQ) biosynthesis protein C